MRFVATIPIVLSIIALVLSFVALFAGHKKGFLEDYSLLTLNTSRIGQNYFNTSQSSSNPITNFFENITDGIEQHIEDGVTSLAHQLGLHDWYSWHVLDLCQGYYTPQAVPNASVPRAAIHENITNCTSHSTLYNLRPAALLQAQLNASGHGFINVTALGVPSDLDESLATVRTASRAMFVLYCVGIGLTFATLVAAVVALFRDDRATNLANMAITSLASFAISTASSIATAVAVTGANTVNAKVANIGIHATHSTKILVVTWIATACLMLVSVVWTVDCCVTFFRRRQKKKAAAKAKADAPESGRSSHGDEAMAGVVAREPEKR